MENENQKSLAETLYYAAGNTSPYDKATYEQQRPFIHQATYILAHKDEVAAEVLGETISRFGANNKVVEVVKGIIIAGLGIAAALGLQGCTTTSFSYDADTGLFSVYGSSQEVEQTDVPPAVQESH